MENQEEYIREKMKEFAMNIDEFSIGEMVEDSDKSLCKITDKTLNTIEVFINRKTKQGVNCKQWFDMKQFNKRFKKSSLCGFTEITEKEFEEKRIQLIND